MSRARLKVYDVYGHREVVIRKTKRGAQAVLRTPKRVRPLAATGPGKSGGGSTPRSTPSGGRAGWRQGAAAGPGGGGMGTREKASARAGGPRFVSVPFPFHAVLVLVQAPAFWLHKHQL